MQTISSKTKIFFLLIFVALPVLGQSLPTFSEDIRAKYREEYKGGEVLVKYVLVRADGSEARSNEEVYPIYLLDIRTDSQNSAIFSREIDRLFKGHFSVEIQHETLLSDGGKDYIILTMSRPAEYNPRYVRCMAARGEDRAYLFAISGGKATVINRFFGGCATRYEVIREADGIGYRVINDGEMPRTVRFMLRGGAVIREPDYRKRFPGAAKDAL